MEELLRQLGLSRKEIQTYELLLKQASLNASQVAGFLKENRTNTYMILERLNNKGLVIYDESKPIRSYLPANPTAIQKIWDDEYRKIRQIKNLMSQTLPALESQYRLSQVKPGVVYLEGLDGLKTMLEDMTKSKTDILLISNYTVTDNTAAFDVLQKGLLKRKFSGIKTLAIFHENPEKKLDVKEFASRNVLVRFWGNREYTGEMAV